MSQHRERRNAQAQPNLQALPATINRPGASTSAGNDNAIMGFWVASPPPS